MSSYFHVVFYTSSTFRFSPAFAFILPPLSFFRVRVFVAAKVPVRYSNRLETAQTRRGEVIFEKYDTFQSMLPSYSSQRLNKRQSEGPTEENPTVSVRKNFVVPVKRLGV